MQRREFIAAIGAAAAVVSASRSIAAETPTNQCTLPSTRRSRN